MLMLRPDNVSEAIRSIEAGSTVHLLVPSITSARVMAHRIAGQTGRKFTTRTEVISGRPVLKIERIV